MKTRIEQDSVVQIFQQKAPALFSEILKQIEETEARIGFGGCIVISRDPDNNGENWIKIKYDRPEDETVMPVETMSLSVPLTAFSEYADHIIPAHDYPMMQEQLFRFLRQFEIS